MAAASPDGGAAANAMVATWCSLDAPGPNGHRQWHVRCRSPRHRPASPLISHGSMIAPLFGTVSAAEYRRMANTARTAQAVEITGTTRSWNHNF